MNRPLLVLIQLALAAAAGCFSAYAIVSLHASGPGREPASTIALMLMLYFAIRKKSVDAVGQTQTEQIEAHAVEQLRNRFADLLGKWPPA